MMATLHRLRGALWLGLRVGLLALGIGSWLGLIFGLVPAQAQEAGPERSWENSIEAIDRIRINTNGDATPDRVGDTVVVAGRVTAQQERFLPAEFLFVQDETGGLAVHLPLHSSIRQGDSLQVQGVLEHKYGLTQLDGLEHRPIEAPPRSPSPLPLTVSAAHGEEYEGHLGRVRGRIVRKASNDGGEYLLLEEPGDDSSPQLSVFVPHRHTDRIPIDHYDSGDQVRVTGIISQFDMSPPYRDYYQLLPRTSDDLERVGVLTPYLRVAIVFIIGGGLLAALAVLTLRVTVKRRTRELTESRARFRRLAEATFEGIIVHDDGEILDTNEALTQMVGVERDVLVGRNVRDVLSDRTEELAEEGMGQGTEGSMEAVLVRTDGTSFPVEIEEKTVEIQGETLHVAALRDISERKKWEAEILLAKEEAEQMARLKSSLLNNMSHELRTPITSIIGYAEVIMEESDGTAKEFASRIRHSGKRLAETLRAVLEMAQLEAGALSPDAHEVNARDVAEEVAEDYASMAQEKGLSVEVDVEEDCVFQTDRSLLYRILDNLVHNAIKFTEEGSVHISAEAVSEGLQFTVRDTGVGIHPDYRSQLFEPFTQESKGRGREYEGIGLGLTLTKRMIELLGGTITVESTKEEGSIFSVILPPLVDGRQEVVLAESDQPSSS